MSDISGRPGVLDPGYEAPLRDFEVERPAAGASGMADLADVAWFTGLGGGSIPLRRCNPLGHHSVPMILLTLRYGQRVSPQGS